MTINTTQKSAGAFNTSGPHTAINGADFLTGDTNGLVHVGKVMSTLLAHFALRGHAVHPISDGRYLVSKYGVTHEALNFAGLLAFAKRLGVTQ